MNWRAAAAIFRIVVLAVLLATPGAWAATAAQVLAAGRPALLPPSAPSARPQEPFIDIASRAAAAREEGRTEEALALYRRALVARPDWDEGRWYLGAMLYELDRYAEAADGFSEVLRHQPSHAGALGMRGLCEFQLRRYDTALADLLKARAAGVAQSPGIATVVRYHAAILLTRFGEFESANQMLTEFAAEGTETPQVLEAFGTNVLRMPVLPEEVQPEARERVMLAGRAGYAVAARLTGAARLALDELVARYPAHPNVHYVRGVFLLTDDPDGALDEFRRELEISPAHVPARLQIAFEYLKRGDASSARTPATEAVALAPDHFATRLALGQVMLESDDPKNALSELEKAATLAPGSPQAHFLLARGYTRLGRSREAERARAEFTRLDQLSRAARHGQQSIGGIPSAGSGLVHPQ